MKVLIESDWNLKSGVVAMSFTNNLGINRIRLEFKAGYSRDKPLLKDFCINRIRLEFKEGGQAQTVERRTGINRIRLEFKVQIQSINSLEIYRY